MESPPRCPGAMSKGMKSGSTVFRRPGELPRWKRVFTREGERSVGRASRHCTGPNADVTYGQEGVNIPSDARVKHLP